MTAMGRDSYLWLGLETDVVLQTVRVQLIRIGCLIKAQEPHRTHGWEFMNISP